MNIYASHLCAQPSFIEGMARIGDITGSLDQYNTSTQPDLVAAWADWSAVGEEIYTCIITVSEESEIAPPLRP